MSEQIEAVMSNEYLRSFRVPPLKTLDNYKWRLADYSGGAWQIPS